MDRIYEHVKRDKHKILVFAKFYPLPEGLLNDSKKHLGAIEKQFLFEIGYYYPLSKPHREVFIVDVLNADNVWHIDRIIEEQMPQLISNRICAQI